MCGRARARAFAGAACAWVFAPGVAMAQDAGSFAASPLLGALALAALALLPLAFMVGTSFVKISVVFSILRNALGTGQVPSGIVITGVSAILSLEGAARIRGRKRATFRPCRTPTSRGARRHLPA